MTEEIIVWDDITQILNRPDAYIGSTNLINEESWFAKDPKKNEDPSDEEKKFFCSSRKINGGLVSLFIEILNNAKDNWWRSKKNASGGISKYIAINVEKDGYVTIKNDGLPIPIEKHNVLEDLYIPEVIFGVLRSSSNYDDTKERFTSGRNGLGAKLTNIFSKEFYVELVSNGMKYTQTWYNNMSETSGPIITKVRKAQTNYTCIRYLVDFERFETHHSSPFYSKSHIELFRRMAIETSMLCNGLKVIFNDDVYIVPSLQKFVEEMFDVKQQCVKMKTKDSEVVVFENPDPEGDGLCLSYVNGSNTTEGGVHVTKWRNAVHESLDKPLSRFLGSNIRKNTLLKYLGFVIKCFLPNPRFKHQEKLYLTSPSPTTSPLTSGDIKLVKGWSFIEELKLQLSFFENKELTKNDAKKNSHLNVTKAIQANKAGGAESSKCSLIITEGDSAKPFAITFIANVPGSNDYYGVYPIKGKFLNVRKATPSQIANNKEISNIKSLIGLKQGLDYSSEANFKTLRYGKVVLLCDPDVDGIHITGLLLVFFYTLFPSLMKLNYVVSLRTPIVKIGKAEFYDYQQYLQYKDSHSLKKRPQYYKGLGSFDPSEVKEYSSKQKQVTFIFDEQGDSKDKLEVAFGKEVSPRKEMMKDFDPSKLEPIIPCEFENLYVNKFITNEFVRYIYEDILRSIPSLVDGMKPSQRKILYGCFKRNLTSELKVSILAGYVAEASAYHGGSTIVGETIMRMCASFVGCHNNIPLLICRGNAGTRIQGGEDFSNPRYPSAKLAPITRKIFLNGDDDILTYLSDDGYPIEPIWYAPIVPMVLVNGSEGIGTGFSSYIHPHKLEDVVESVRHWIETGEAREVYPYYEGFVGKYSDGYTYGNYFIKGPSTLVITELPVKVWTQDFNDHLLSLKARKIITNFTKNISENTLKFTINSKTLVNLLQTNNSRDDESKSLDKTLDFLLLRKKMMKPNMTLHDNKGKLRKFETTKELLEVYCSIRLKLYVKTKENLLLKLAAEMNIIESKIRYISAVLENHNFLLRRPKLDLVNQLKTEDYFIKDGDETFDYLLSMRNDTLTRENISKLHKQYEEKKKEVSRIKRLSPQEMWLSDLNVLMKSPKIPLNSTSTKD